MSPASRSFPSVEVSKPFWRLFILASLLLKGFAADIDVPESCKDISGGQELSLVANASTVHWGYFFNGVEPNLVASSGDIIDIEMITHHAGDDYDKMIKGDPGVEDIYQWASTGQNVDMRGKSGSGDGVHVMTGPIYVCGAEPGDVLQIDILDLKPRANPSTGKTYGSNAAAWWGYQFRAGFLDGDPREVITIYEVVEEDGDYYAVPDYQFRFAGGPTGYPGPTTPCATLNGSLPEAAPGFEFDWSNPDQIFSGNEIPCINGTQTWGRYDYPGLITSHPTGTEDSSIKGLFKVPANFHIGNIGLAPKYDSTVDSVPPLVTGGNMDNRRIGIGSTLFLPVEVAGAFLSAGDAHTAQGDSELDGTGIETSINGKFKLTLHKKDDLPVIVEELKYPLIETADTWVVQGYTYADYLEELEDPMSTIYGESSIDKAMTVAYNNTRDWMMNTLNMTEDQAITAITVAVDFAITQVVDGNWGVHASIPKGTFGLPTVGATTQVKSTDATPAASGASTIMASSMATALATILMAFV
ncbi:hypothetical protein M9434_006316 [Picochlorum sp. BPE23]|nr:hypothetical protein M9434_006316 [Picochlorum sp. BPE23]